MDWFAIYTKPGAEALAAENLRRAGIETLSPKIRTKKFRRQRLVESVEPLFPCYIFARLDLGRHLHMVSFTRGIRYVVGGESPTGVPEGVIDSIRENVRDGVVVPRPGDFNKGERVRIMDGALKDFRGVFTGQMKGSERVTVLLDAMGFRVEVDRHLVGKA
jgi:transcriptional antiterminator RfaH